MAVKKITAKDRALWSALNHFITMHGGWTVSERERWPIQMQCPFSSDLPAKLADVGYQVVSKGSVTRVTHTGPVPVEAFQIAAHFP